MEGYIGEIRMFAGNFAPRGWAFCNGTQYNISDYTTVFSIIGTIYGGDGQTTFKLPDLRGRLPLGTGPHVALGEVGGTETTTMTIAQMPAHNHITTATIALPAISDGGDIGVPSDAVLGGLGGAYSTQAADTHIAPATTTGSLSVTGSGIPFSIVQPVLATNYIICIEGIYPSRS